MTEDQTPIKKATMTTVVLNATKQPHMSAVTKRTINAIVKIKKETKKHEKSPVLNWSLFSSLLASRCF